jgi:hypothetical protein
MAGATSERLEDRIGELVWHPFDLATGPLFRATLLRVDDADATLVLVVHHLAFDKSSMDTVYRDLNRFYAAEPRAFKTPLTTPEFGAWQREVALRDRERLGSFWRGYLERCVPLGADVLACHDGVDRGERGVITFDFDDDVARAARRAASRAGVPLVAFVHAVLSTLLFARTGRTAITCGYLLDLRVHYKLHNRDRTTADVKDTVGCLIGGVPIHVDIDPDAAASQMLLTSNAEISAVTSHAEVPPMAVVDGDRAAYGKLFSVLLNFQKVRGKLELPGTSTEEYPPIHAVESRGRSASGIQLRICEGTTELTGLLAYDGALMGETSARAFVDAYKRLFEQFASESTLTLRELAELVRH